MSSESLNVIALISGGKDSFYNALHCLEHGHRIVALANLMPADYRDEDDPDVEIIHPGPIVPDGSWSVQDRGDSSSDDEPETDLNSFMYQTVGHEIIPFYATITGLPLYRRAISGGAVRHERDYDSAAAVEAGGDETESMIPLLQAVLQRHPEANAVCAGAILSTYQRTRVESVAQRLGLTALAFLWKYPILPGSDSGPGPYPAPPEDVQLLRDMADAGLEARIIKVASAGLSEAHLWEHVSSSDGAKRVKDALRKFGSSSGAAVLGEGGEFETVVVDGPTSLFSARITIPDYQRQVVREGGGSSWLILQGARLEDKPEVAQPREPPRVPGLYDYKFASAFMALFSERPAQTEAPESGHRSRLLGKSPTLLHTPSHEPLQLAVMSCDVTPGRTVESETVELVDSIRQLLSSRSLEPAQISNTVVILRRMSDFVKVNSEYAKLFTKPNPPSRVTISCGDLLPAGSNIGIYLTVDPTPLSVANRQALHVQSRSYWAPANIGPYSQAVGTQILSPKGQKTGLRSWSVAGQIPLIPHIMELPESGGTSHLTQIVLSLQHLWRIGLDQRIQLWTSAVAFFARSSDSERLQDDVMRENAELAGRAWRIAHGGPPDDDDEDEGQLDPWDLKYNAEHYSLAVGNESNGRQHPLPDWSVFTLRQQNEPSTCIPPVFSVEVEELPRRSEVEWQAHVGLSGVDAANIEVLWSSELKEPLWKGWNVVARSEGSAFVHSVLARDATDDPVTKDFDKLQSDLSSLYKDSLNGIGLPSPDSVSPTPYICYIDTNYTDKVWPRLDGSAVPLPFPIIPCHSIWSRAGERLDIIAVYKTTVSL